MMTVYQKVMTCVVSNFGAGTFTRQELLSKMEHDFPNVPKESILPSDYCVNRVSSGSGGLNEDDLFLYAIDTSKYRLFDPQRDSRHTIKSN